MKRFFSRRRSRRAGRLGKACRRQLAPGESLEPRNLLAGNITASVVNGDLRLSGDRLDNTALISVVEGDVVVEGLDATTINGIDAPFVAFAGTAAIADDLLAKLGGGHDVLLLSGGLEVADRVVVRGGSGSARVGLDDVSVGGHVGILGTPGDDVVHWEDVAVVGDVKIRLRQGDDVVNLLDTSSDDLAIHTGGGADAVVLEEVFTSDDTYVLTGRGVDDVVVVDSDIEDDLMVRTGRDDDFVMIDPTQVGDFFVGSFGQGHDMFVDQGGNRYGGLWINGGPGSDAAQFDEETTIDGRQTVRRTESDSVAEEEVERRLNDPDQGALTRATGAAEFFAAFFNDDNGNAPPVGEGIADVTVDENAPDEVIDLFAAFEDDEDPDEALTYELANTNEALFAETVLDPVAGSLRLVFAPDTSGSAVLTVTATDTGGLGVETEFMVTVIPAGPLTLSIDTSANDTIASSGTLLTNQPLFAIAGTTAPGAAVDVDRDGDGAFNDGSTVADALGSFSLDVTLLHNDQNQGAQTLEVRAQQNGQQVTQNVGVHLAVGSVVRFASTLGNWDVELLDADAPNTVAAFLQDLSRYSETVVHRNVDQFVVQGGSFRYDSPSMMIVDAPVFPAVPNEFSAASPPNSNQRGTLSTAQTSDPDSFRGAWFFNTVNNNAEGNVNLDAVPHNPFGRVIGTGMSVVDAIQATPTFGIGGTLPNSGAFAQTPLLNYTPAFQPISGTVSVTAGSRFVSGTGTAFGSQLTNGQGLQIDGQQLAVSRIFSDTLLELAQFPQATASGVTAARNTASPQMDNFVTIDSVTKLLDPPDSVANTFAVFENALEGTVIGRIVANNGANGSKVYQIDDPGLSDDLKLGAVDHRWGDPTARAVLIEYLDLQCPACKALHPTITQLAADFADDLLVVRRHLPLTAIHPRAFDAAIATEAAARQDRFDEMVDRLFDTQGEAGEWTDPAVVFQDRIEFYANDLGLEIDQFRSDQGDPNLVERVNRDLGSASRLGAVATPTVYLNGTQIPSPAGLDLSEYADLVQGELDAFDAPFLMNRNNGDLIVADSGQLDFETQPTFTVDVYVANAVVQRIASTIQLIDIVE